MVGGSGETAAVVLDCMKWLFPVLLKWPLQRELGSLPKAGDGARLSQLRDACYCGPVHLSLLLCMDLRRGF